MIHRAESGHPGGSLSVSSILLCLYEKILNFNPKNPDDPNRDRLILSKGHAAPALYAVLAKYGYFSSELLDNFRQFKSSLQGHPHKLSLPGIEISTGSLGMGISAGIGMALSAKLDNLNTRTYVILGDGECQEGCVWEAAMAAAHFKLDNLIVIVDRNGLQLDDTTEKILSIEPFAAKWDAFGWIVIEIDGTSIREILMALNTAKDLLGKPVVIISYMIKGQGVSFMEHIKKFHGIPLNQEELHLAFSQLDNYKNLLIKKAEMNKKIIK